jgi:hypothetical protein
VLLVDPQRRANKVKAEGCASLSHVKWMNMMFKKSLVAALMVSLVASELFAGPFGLTGRRRGTVTTTTAGTQQVNQVRHPIANGFLGTAQGVANYLASIGRIGHYGGNPFAYEGVGMGASPDQALRNCCNNGGVVADYGVCQGSNGMWYACKRYHGR